MLIDKGWFKGLNGTYYFPSEKGLSASICKVIYYKDGEEIEGYVLAVFSLELYMEYYHDTVEEAIEDFTVNHCHEEEIRFMYNFYNSEKKEKSKGTSILISNLPTGFLEE